MARWTFGAELEARRVALERRSSRWISMVDISRAMRLWQARNFGCRRRIIPPRPAMATQSTAISLDNDITLRKREEINCSD